MTLKPDQERIRSLLAETITLLCRNGLNFKSEFSVEALIGITLDNADVFLVNIKETVKSPEHLTSNPDTGATWEESFDRQSNGDGSLELKMFTADVKRDTLGIRATKRSDASRYSKNSLHSFGSYYSNSKMTGISRETALGGTDRQRNVKSNDDNEACGSSTKRARISSAARIGDKEDDGEAAGNGEIKNKTKEDENVCLNI